jgi:deazaflavin-dependent oxidoreductase (nitroreductase family)
MSRREPVHGDRATLRLPRSRLLVLLFRAPIGLYGLGLGWLLGHRFLLLTHRGRVSGRVYQTVIEVVRYDSRTRESVVVSGWGTQADWYRNIRASPPIEVQTARERYQPTCRELAPEENYPIVADYVRRMPPVARPLAYRLGLDVPGPEEERRAHAARLLLIGFRPRSNNAASQVTEPSPPPAPACSASGVTPAYRPSMPPLSARRAGTVKSDDKIRLW